MPDLPWSAATAHTVLEHTYRRLREETGERRVTCEPGCAERILLEELRARSSAFRLSPKATRVRTASRRLEFDLLRHLRSEADSDSRFEPEHLELRFGYGEDRAGSDRRRPARARADRRVDTSDGMALVIDYKSGKRVDRYKAASWEPENRFQAALYMLVVERLLGLRAAGGVYVALLGGGDPLPRGMVGRRGRAGSGYFKNDMLGEDEFRAKLDWALERIRATDAAMPAASSAPARALRLERWLQVPSICRSTR